MDRRQSREISSRLFSGVKSHNPIAATDQSLEKMMEQYDSTISWKNSRKSSMVLCTGQLTIGYIFRQKEEDQRKGYNIV